LTRWTCSDSVVYLVLHTMSAVSVFQGEVKIFSIVPVGSRSHCGLGPYQPPIQRVVPGEYSSRCN